MRPKLAGADRRSDRARIVILAVAIALALGYTWPLATDPRGAFVYGAPWPTQLAHADLYLTSWILSWGAHQILHDPLRLFEANVLYPLPHALAFSEHMLASALLILPLDVVHHDAVLDHNVLLLASFALGAAGTAFLVRDLGGSLPAALAAGTLFATGPLRWAQLGHVHALSTQWMPFALLFLQRFLRDGRIRSAIPFALTLWLAALSSIYYLYYFGIAVVAFLALHAACGCAARPASRRRALGLGLGVLLAIVPLLLPYAAVRTQFALAHDPAQAVEFSAVGVQYLGTLLDPRSLLHRAAVDGRLQSPLVGIGLLALAGLGLARGARPARGGRRIAATYAALAAVFAVLSLGPTMRMYPTPATGLPGPHRLLAAFVPGFDALRVPQRAASIALLALAVLAGLGADGLVAGRRAASRRWAGGLVVAALVLLECWRPALHLVPETRADGAAAPVYRWLAEQPTDFPVLELPIGDATADFVKDSRYMMCSTYHWKRLVNGYTGTLPARAYLRRVLARFPDTPSLRLLHALRVRYVIVHVRDVILPQAALCAADDDRLAPYLARRWADRSSCALEVLGAPPAVAPVDRAVSLAEARFSTSSDDDPVGAHDGDLRTHWVQTVTRDPGWVQIDLPKAHPLTRIVVRLGTHFGEYLRARRVATSPDGVDWTTVADEPVAEAPLAGLVEHPEDLTTDIRLGGAPVAHMRLVRPEEPVPLLYLDWGWWGIHEIELYERADSP